MKLVIGLKSGKSYQKELNSNISKTLYEKAIGDSIKINEFDGCEFVITGGSDYTGVPMRKDISGIKRKKILTRKSIGFRGKLRKKRFDGLRIKKTIAGNLVYEKTNQLNVKCVKGEKNIEAMFKLEEKQEEAPKENSQ